MWRNPNRHPLIHSTILVFLTTTLIVAFIMFSLQTRVITNRLNDIANRRKGDHALILCTVANEGNMNVCRGKILDYYTERLEP